MKLWDKGYQLDEAVEAFMTGDDPLLDIALLPYDCLGSMAHASMLAKIGILTTEECHQLLQGLSHILSLAKKGLFTIKQTDEDVHTAVENYLVESLGNLGKKLHTARSRNDQVLLDMRLYMRDQILQTMEALASLSQVLIRFADENHAVPIPGRTHFQHAMPSSLGLWAGAFTESLLDDGELLKSAFDLINQSPLGSAASYGVSLPIDRQYCAELLGFRCVQNNVLYANNSRGKFEAIVLHALAQIMNDLSKLATDIIIFSAPEFGYLKLPEKFCPGSSLMPQKRNPCPLELIRAKSATVQGLLFQTLEIIRSLPSGYNRDFQETKRPLMQGFDMTLASLHVFLKVFEGIQIDQDACLKAFTPELFATDQVLQLAKNGVPFRDAYRQVAQSLESVSQADPVTNILSKIHQGATGNLGLEQSRFKADGYINWIQHHQSNWDALFKKLIPS
ncbi:argininosuccinate lyase [Candidatus Protochlamydia phocaeensis]|uniref:argininosuccinate lyase n=1 Tax=Candidatus Protochlamydia phocaeensis TaxID=1414722 RepID=UPI000837C6FF|nr:argininosuccinate lyase [Candidatus Protochlamydia phocaeensis]